MGLSSTYSDTPDKTKHSFEGGNGELDFAGTELKGWRSKMEDHHLTLTNYDGDPTSTLFAIFDGHGGISSKHQCRTECVRVCE
jgi:hypothetical protein